MKDIEVKGNWSGLLTALIVILGIAWESYKEYRKLHVEVATLQPPSPAVTPIYWNDGQRWWCQIGDKRYVWNGSQQR
jgi:hypothetical protein